MKPCPVVHFELGCQNLEKTGAFYAKAFGWSYAPQMPGMPPMAMVQNLGPYAPAPDKNPDGIGGHINSLGHPPHQYVTFYVLVDDVDAKLAEITKLGGSVMIPKQEVPGMGYFAWFKDPEGNVLGLWKEMA